MKSSDIDIRAISQEMPQPSITKLCFKIMCLKFRSNFPGDNELIMSIRFYKLVSQLAKGRSLAATDLSSERLTRKYWNENFDKHADGLVQDCGISIANAPGIL